MIATVFLSVAFFTSDTPYKDGMKYFMLVYLGLAVLVPFLNWVSD